jgi:hypothetical protein
MSLFNVIDELYPRKQVAEQLKQHTPVHGGAASYYQKPKIMVQNPSGKSSANFRHSTYHAKNPPVNKSLV